MRALVFLCLFLFPSFVNAKTYVFDDKCKVNEVSFKVGTNIGSTIVGKGGKINGNVNGDPTGFAGDLSLNLADFDTDSALRNKHFKKYLNVDQKPKATLRLWRHDPWDEKKEFEWHGLLILNGSGHEVSGKATVTGQSLVATFNLNIDDFHIEQPSFLGVKVNKDVEITVKAEAN